MSHDAPPVTDSGPRPIPPWVMTFADLMSLLMCFFVLLLAFSEMDAQKYKQLSGSMENAFGVQRDVKAHEIPRGISIIAKEFSAGRPDPTPLNQVRQKATDSREKFLDIGQADDADGKGERNKEKEGEGDSDIDAESQAQVSYFQEVEQELDLESLSSKHIAEKMISKLENEIRAGKVEVAFHGGKRVIIRIKDKGSFPGGSATLHRSFVPVLNKIRAMLAKAPGSIVIAGHTDNRPVVNARFRSNWDLSVARAVSVAHELISGGDGSASIDARRVEVKGHADTRPLKPNDTEEHRDQNRRVEILLIQGSKGAEAKEYSHRDEMLDELDRSNAAPDDEGDANIGEVSEDPAAEVEASEEGNSDGEISLEAEKEAMVIDELVTEVDEEPTE